MMIGADVGGTFTDVVSFDGVQLRTAKVPTSAVQSEAIVMAMDDLAAGSQVRSLVHGTTVATNALLERKGARTMLLTNVGFEDIIEIGRQDRPSLYDPYDDRSEPLVTRDDRHGMEAGDALPQLDDVESVAVVFVEGHVDPTDERLLRDAVRQRRPSLPVSLSSDVAPEFREYERVSTTVLNAYLTPLTARYLRQLDEEVVGAGRSVSVAVMRSSGGLIALDEAAALPAAILLSGPAGGAIAAEAVATGLGRSRVISFDMGGTSTDVCRIDNGVIDVSYERSIDGYPCRLPSVGIHTVGAGGGSIAWIDSGGALRVGPQSAGAHPGPASYGLGGIDPTVTDANVVLGRIDAHAIFGDSVAIDVGRAKRAVESVASPLELSLTDAALGIVRIAEEVMAGAVRTVSVEQGADPAGAWLIAFGGAGGLHAPAIARSLGMAGVIVPRHSGVFSALGLLLSPPRADAVAAVNIMNDRLDDARIVGEGLDRQVRRQLVRAGHEPGRVGFALDVRYLGQAHEITVAWSPNEEVAVVRQRFEKLHRQRNGFIRGEDPLEIVAVRCTAVGDPPMSRDVLGAWTPGEKRESTSRMTVTAHHGERSADVIDRLGLAAGDAVYGPAIIEEREATTFLDVGETATVTKDGSLEVTW